MLILFIDEDHEDFEMFCEATQTIRPGIECIFKQNGASALQFLEQAVKLPDCIFLDINMRGMGGIDCLSGIRAIEKMKNVPVVIFSADIYRGSIGYYEKLGANEFLTKPSTYPALVQLLSDFLDRLRPL